MADSLAQFVSSHGHRVWRDREIMVGQPIDSQLASNLRRCDGYVIIVTRSALASPWVLIELGGAWVAQLPIFPVVHEIQHSELPDPLRNVNCSDFSDIAAKLLPALIQLADDLDALMPASTDAEVNAIAMESIAKEVRLAKLADQVRPFVADSLSPDRSKRRIAHIGIWNQPKELKQSYLQVMRRLSEHEIGRIRGEAFYCLGCIPLVPGEYLCDDKFLQKGLYDESHWVQACCANVLRNFIPLSPQTISRLEECRDSNMYKMKPQGPTTSLVFHASETISANKAITRAFETYDASRRPG